jgi:cell division protein FtsN
MRKPATNARAGARASILAAIAVAVVVAVGVAYAAIPTTGGNLPACANNETGILRMLAPEERCTPEETEI